MFAQVRPEKTAVSGDIKIFGLMSLVYRGWFLRKNLCYRIPTQTQSVIRAMFFQFNQALERRLKFIAALLNP